MLETLNFVHELTIQNISFFTDCDRRGRDHMTHFDILDLANFSTPIRRCIGVVSKSRQLVDYTYDDRVRRG